MKLTDESLDYPDCMPPRANNSIELSPEQEERFARAKAAREARRASEKRSPRLGRMAAERRGP